MVSWYGCFEVRHLSRKGTYLWKFLERLDHYHPEMAARLRQAGFMNRLLERETLFFQEAANTLADEGEQLLEQVFFQGAALTTFYLALVNDTLVETDTLATMLGEPTTNGYARQQITRDATGWPTLALNIAADETGTAQAGANTTITLAAAASATNDFYVGCIIETTGGTGPRQWNFCTAYVGSTKVATVSRQWTVNPDSTTTYKVHSDYRVQSKLVTFSASGGSWGPVNTAVLTNVASGTAGKLIAYAALSAAQTPGAGESFTVTYKDTIRAG